MAKAPTPPPPWRSGFCGIGLPPDSHTRCHGSYQDRPCICDCHQEEPVTEVRTEVDAWQQKQASDLPPMDHATDRATLDDLSLEQAVALARAAATRLTEVAVASNVETLDPEEATEQLRYLRDAVWLLGTVDDALVRHIYLKGEHGKQLMEGVGEVYVGRSRSNEKWDERGVAQAVIDAKMADFAGAERGELPDPWDVAEWLLEVLGVGYVRKTALDTLGIPRAPFYDSTPGKLKVDVPRLR